MMAPNIALDLVDFTVREVRPLLARILTARQGMEFNRFFLARVRDRIDDACRRFEAGDASEIYEPLYLPLFDALGFLNSGLALSPINEAPIREASRVLEILDERVRRAPVDLPVSCV